MKPATVPVKQSGLRNPKSAARIDIQVAARYLDNIKSALLREAARATLEQQRLQGDLTIVITGNAQLRALNREFRGVDAPTDVLSFATDDQPQASKQTRYLGDVIISYTQANEQAKVGGHPVEAELQLLVVHGVLHLLGHDHDTRPEKARMWQAQAKILKSISAAITEPKD
jgi:probable rRNA maturation factor